MSYCLACTRFLFVVVCCLCCYCCCFVFLGGIVCVLYVLDLLCFVVVDYGMVVLSRVYCVFNVWVLLLCLCVGVLMCLSCLLAFLIVLCLACVCVLFVYVVSCVCALFGVLLLLFCLSGLFACGCSCLLDDVYLSFL